MHSGGNVCKPSVQKLICRQSNQFVVAAQGLTTANQDEGNRLVPGTPDTGQERRHLIGQRGGTWEDTSQLEEGEGIAQGLARPGFKFRDRDRDCLNPSLYIDTKTMNLEVSVSRPRPRI